MEIKHFFAFATKKFPTLHGINWLWLKMPTQSNWRKKLLLVTGVAFIVLISTAIGNIVHQAEMRVKVMPCFQIKPDSLTIDPLPPQLTPYITQIAPASLTNLSLNIFSVALVKELSAAYLANPWVEQVYEVRKRYPDRISVRLGLRQPTAWIFDGETHCLGDGTGVRLPVTATAVEMQNGDDRLPVIYGVAGELPAIGKKWLDSDLIAALEVLQFLLTRMDHREPRTITQIHLHPTVPVQLPGIVLMLEHPGCQVVWGEALASQFPQVSAEARYLAFSQFCQTAETWSEVEIASIGYADVRFGYVIVQEKDKKWQLPRNPKKAPGRQN